MADTEYTPKEVIENKLLAALDDDGQVAIVLNRADLDCLIAALEYAPEPWGRRTEMLDDLRKLRSGAFGE